MELKSRFVMTITEMKSSNCTFMELKLISNFLMLL